MAHKHSRALSGCPKFKRKHLPVVLAGIVIFTLAFLHVRGALTASLTESGATAVETASGGSDLLQTTDSSASTSPAGEDTIQSSSVSSSTSDATGEEAVGSSSLSSESSASSLSSLSLVSSSLESQVSNPLSSSEESSVSSLPSLSSFSSLSSLSRYHRFSSVSDDSNTSSDRASSLSSLSAQSSGGETGNTSSTSASLSSESSASSLFSIPSLSSFSSLSLSPRRHRSSSAPEDADVSSESASSLSVTDTPLPAFEITSSSTSSAALSASESMSSAQVSDVSGDSSSSLLTESGATAVVTASGGALSDSSPSSQSSADSALSSIPVAESGATVVVTASGGALSGSGSGVQSSTGSSLSSASSLSLAATLSAIPALPLSTATHPAFALPKSVLIASATDLADRLKVEVTDASGASLAMQTDVTATATGYLVTLLPQFPLRPAHYRVTFTLPRSRGALGRLWETLAGDDALTIYDGLLPLGFLALNADKPSYRSGETAQIVLTALDEDGRAVCGAAASAELTSPDGSTRVHAFTAAPSCLSSAVAATPDYALSLPLSLPGNYRVSVKVTIGGTVREAAILLPVSADAEQLAVRREAHTRLLSGLARTVTLTLFPRDTFIGSVTEQVPDGFTVTDVQPQGRMETGANGTQIVWSRKFHGQTSLTLSYTLTAVSSSPRVTTLGPLEARGTIERTIVQEEASSSSSVSPVPSGVEGSGSSLSSLSSIASSLSGATAVETASGGSTLSSSSSTGAVISSTGSALSSSSSTSGGSVFSSAASGVPALGLPDLTSEEMIELLYVPASASSSSESSLAPHSAPSVTESSPSSTESSASSDDVLAPSTSEPAADAQASSDSSDALSPSAGPLSFLRSFLPSASVLTANLTSSSDLRLSFTESRAWELVVLPAAQRAAEDTPTPLTLDPVADGVVIPSGTPAAFTLLHSLPQSFAGQAILDAEGHLKEANALEAIAGAVTTTGDIENAAVNLALQHDPAEVASALARDSAAASIVQGEDTITARRRTEVIEDKVSEALRGDSALRDTVADIVTQSGDAAAILGSVVTEGVKQAVLQAITADPSTAQQVLKTAIEKQDPQALAALSDTVATIARENAMAVAQAVADADGTNTGDKPLLSVTMKDRNGNEFTPRYHFQQGSVVLVLEPEREFTPGLYTLEVTVTNPLTNETQTLTQDFAWGVLAMNTDQDTYRLNETGSLSIGVLDDEGKIICDAKLSLSVASPLGEVTEYETNPGFLSSREEIAVTGTCGRKDSTMTSPDYEAILSFSEAGTYELKLTAETENGVRSMTQHVEVGGGQERLEGPEGSSRPVIVTRKAATRLYPLGNSPMDITVEFFEDFTGTMTDTVPGTFKILDASGNSVVKKGTEEKTIAWKGTWKAGETATFSYTFDAPDVSPDFFTVGPLAFTFADSSVSFEEARVWQIANDDPGDEGSQYVGGDGDGWATGAAYHAFDSSIQFYSADTYQTFVVGQSATAISQLTIVDTGSITAANDIRIHIPDSLGMTWNEADTAAVLGGTAAGKASGTVSYEDAGKTLLIDVADNFSAGDDLTIAELSFHNFSAQSLGKRLTLETGNDGSMSATGATVISIAPAAGAAPYAGGDGDGWDASGVNLLTSFDAFNTYTWTGLGADGNCSTRANWDHNSLPDANSDITFISDYGSNATWDTGCTATPHSLTLSSGYAGTVALGSNISLSGSVILAAGTLDANVSGNHGIVVAGNWTNNGGTFTPRNGTVTFSGTGQTIGGSSGTTFYNLVKSVSVADTLTFTHGTTITVQHATTLAGASEDARLRLRSDSAGTQWLIDPSSTGTRTIQYVDVQDSNNTNATAITCETGCVNSLNNTNWAFPVTGTVYAADGVTPLASVTVALSVDGAPPLASGDTTELGVFLINLGETVLESGQILTLYLDGETEKAVTVTVTDGVSISSFQLKQDHLIVRHETAGPVTTANLVTANTQADSDISALYAVSDNDLILSSGKHLDVHTGDTFVPASAVTLSGGGDIRSDGTITAPSAVTADGIDVAGSFSASGAVTANDVTVSGILATETTLQARDIRVTGTGSVGGMLTARDLTVQRRLTAGGATSVRNLTATGTLALGANPVTVSGNLHTRNGTITATAPFTLSGSGSHTIIANNSTIPSLTLSGAGSFSMSGALAVSSTLTISSGSVLDLSGSSLTVPSTFTNYGTVKLEGSETLTFTNDTAHGTLEYNGPGAHTGLAGKTAFHNLTLSGAGTWTLNAPLTVVGSVLLADASLDQNGQALGIAGSWTDDGGTFTGNGTVTFTGSGSISEDDPFDEFVVNSDAQSVTVSDPLSVSGSLLIHTGQLAVGNADPTITVEGNWENEAGSLSAGSGTVVMSGDDQSMSGSTLFWNLKKEVGSGATWTFGAGDTQSVNGTWTAKGAVGQTLYLASSDPGTTWKISPIAYDLQYITITDSENISGETILAANDAVNGGGNIDWAFPVAVTVKTKAGALSEGGKTVAIAVNGGTAVTSDTNASSVATFNDGVEAHLVSGIESGALLAIWLSGEAENGMLVTRTNGTSLSFTLYEDTITIQSEVGTAITNGDLNTASGAGINDDINTLYTMSGSTELVAADDTTLRIETGDTFRPGGDVTAHDFDINGHFDMETYTVTVTGSWDATGGSFTGNNTVRFTSTEAETITVNSSAFNNVIFVVSHDPSAQVGNWTTVDGFTVDGSQWVQNGATNPGVAPVISNVVVTPFYDKLAVVRWETDVVAMSRVYYGTESGALTAVSTASSGSVLGRAHAVTLTDLTPATTYYAKPVSGDYWNNTAEGEIISFTTLAKLSTAEELAEAEGAAYSAGKKTAGGGGRKPYDECTLTRADPFLLTNVAVQGDGGTTVSVTWTTNHSAVSVAQYGVKSVDERAVVSLNGFVTDHALTLTDLEPGATYLLKAASVDQCGQVAYSDEISLTTAGQIAAEHGAAAPSASSQQAAAASSQSSSADDLGKLQEALDALKSLAEKMSLGEFKRTLVAHNDSMREIAGMLPGPFLSGEPRVTVTDTTATVTWKTDEPANSLVAFSPAAIFRDDEYASQTGDFDVQTSDHSVTITSLAPGTTYHYQVRSETPIGTRSVSGDFTFATLTKRASIDTYSVDTLSPESAAFRWETNVETTSRLTLIPYQDGVPRPEEALTFAQNVFTTRHELTGDTLEPGVVYSVELAGNTADGTQVSQAIPKFSTSKQYLAPVISRVKADVALSPGKQAAIQMIISWDTNERATSRVRYQQGVVTDIDVPLAKTTPLEQTFGRKHTVILTDLDPGAVYSFQAESANYDGLVTTSKTFTVLTPRQQQGIFEVISKEFGDTFGWLRGMTGQ